MCNSLKWNTIDVKSKFEQLVANFTYEATCQYLEDSDIVEDDFEKILKKLESLLKDDANKNRLNEFLKKIDLGNVFKDHEGELNPKENNISPAQIIYYGVPGAGKSHKIDTEYLDKLKAKFPDKTEREKHFIRVVFHPDYTNADFVGQIMPSVEILRDEAGNIVKDENGKPKTVVKYEFKPGPLAKILARAYNDIENPYYLIIEEINRGNAAAIFGETFQLMDRIEKDDQDYPKGWSAYSVENEEIMREIRKEYFKKNNGGENPSADYWAEHGFDDIEIDGVNITAVEGFRLPPNLSILATMNTSDQNVFTLDNAFQRRFKMELVPNEFGDSAEETVQSDASIGGCNQKWNDFRKKVNEQISTAASSMEDKRLGPWFIKADVTDGTGVINASDFADKVIKYLWDDAFKHDPGKEGKFGFNSFEETRKAFLDCVEKGEKGNSLGSLFEKFDFSRLPETPATEQAEEP